MNPELLERRGRSLRWGYGPPGFPKHDFVNPKVHRVQPLMVRTAGTDHWVEGCFRQRVFSDVCAIECITEGSMHVVQGAHATLAKPGDVFLIHPGRDHQMQTGPEGVCLKHTLIIAGTALGALMEAWNLQGRNVLRPGGFGEIIEAIDVIRRKILEEDVGQELYGVLRLLSESPMEEELPEPLAKALEVQGREHLSLPELARAAGVSPSTLNRLYSKHLGQTAVAWQNRKRMLQAGEALRDGGTSIQEVGRKLGWDDAPSFSSAFKRAFGMSPRDYRRYHWKEMVEGAVEPD